MATSNDVKVAADAVASAKATLASAESDVTTKELAAFALIPSEIAAANAANEALNTALDGARATVGWYEAEAARIVALNAKNLAVEDLVLATATYDES